MSILDRLSGIDDENKIEINAFYGAVMGNITNNVPTRNAIRTEFGIVGGSDLTEWDAMMASLDTAIANSNEAVWLVNLLGGLMLAEVRLFSFENKAVMNSHMQAGETPL